MKVSVKTLENKAAGDMTLADSVFGIEPRADIMARVVNWQLAKRRAGTHKVQMRSEIARPAPRCTARKVQAAPVTVPVRPISSVVVVLCMARLFVITVTACRKRSVPLACAQRFPAKARDGKLIILDGLKANGKTAALKGKLNKLGLDNALIIGGAEVDDNFQRAASNIPNIDVLPQQGINVYDILRRDVLVLTKDSAAHLEERLK